MFQYLWDIPSFILRFLYVTVINKKWIYSKELYLVYHAAIKKNNNAIYTRVKTYIILKNYINFDDNYTFSKHNLDQEKTDSPLTEGGTKHNANISVQLKSYTVDQILRYPLHNYHKLSIKSFVLTVY